MTNPPRTPHSVSTDIFAAVMSSVALCLAIAAEATYEEGRSMTGPIAFVTLAVLAVAVASVPHLVHRNQAVRVRRDTDNQQDRRLTASDR